MKRAQGLAFSTIVMGAIALLVLFIVGFIFLNWARGAAASTMKDVDNFKNNCRIACGNLQSESALAPITFDDLKNSDYMKKVLDTSKFGGTAQDHCYDDGQDLVDIKCPDVYFTLTDTSGKTYVCHTTQSTDWTLLVSLETTKFEGKKQSDCSGSDRWCIVSGELKYRPSGGSTQGTGVYCQT